MKATKFIIPIILVVIVFIFGNSHQFPERRSTRFESLVALMESLMFVAFSPIYLLYNIVTASTQLPDTMTQNDYHRVPSGAKY